MSIHSDSPQAERAAANQTRSSAGQVLNPALPADKLAALQGNPAPAPQPQPAAAPAPFTPKYSPIMNQQPTNQIPSMTGFASHNPSALSGQPAAEALKMLMDTVTEVTKTGTEPYKLTLVPVSRHEMGELFVSSLVLAMTHSAASQSKTQLVAYHVLILADTAQTLQPVQRNINGRNVEILRVVGDAYDDVYRRAVAKALQRAFPNVPPENMLDAEAELIPKGYDYKNQDLVRRTLVNALTGAGTVLNSNTEGFVDFSLSNNAAALNSKAVLFFNQPQQADPVGQPVRTDVRIEYSEVKTATTQGYAAELQSLNTAEQDTPVFAIGGFMDLMWHPANGAQQQHNPYIAQNPAMAQQATHLYTPRFVITKMDPLVLKTLPEQLLGLATVLTLRDNNNWVGAFQPKAGSGFRLHDIGAIGYETALADRIDTSSDSFRPENFQQLMTAFVRESLVVSLDVAECGPDTWFNSIFLAAAMGSTDANNSIVEAANLLTNGKFEQIYRGAGAVVIDDQCRIHNGWYLDANQVQRDIRDIDYLAVLNMLGHQDLALARDWSDSFAYTQFAQELRLATRRSIIERTINSAEVHFTGFSRRVSFRHDFLQALAQAVVATGLTIRPVTPFQEMSTQPRATAAWLEQAQLQAANSGLFARSFGQPVQGNFNRSTTFGRWGN